MRSGALAVLLIHLFTLNVIATMHILPLVASSAVLEVRVTKAPDTVLVGEEFTIEAIILNKGDEPVEFEVSLFSTKPFHTLDFRIGSSSWNKTVLLKPGESINITAIIKLEEPGERDFYLLALKERSPIGVAILRILAVDEEADTRTSGTLSLTAVEVEAGEVNTTTREVAPASTTIEAEAGQAGGQEPLVAGDAVDGGAPWLGQAIGLLLIIALAALGVLARVPERMLILMLTVPATMILSVNILELVGTESPTLPSIIGYIVSVGLLPPILLYLYGRGVAHTMHKLLGGLAVVPAVVESSYTPYLGWESILDSIDYIIIYVVSALAIVAGAASRRLEGKFILVAGLAMWQVYTTLLFIAAVLWST